MKIKPIFTEKSMREAKNGKFSFWVLPSLTKNQIVFRTTNGRKYRISNIAADTRLLGTIRRGERLGRSKGGFIAIQIIQDNELLSFFDLQVV